LNLASERGLSDQASRYDQNQTKNGDSIYFSGYSADSTKLANAQTSAESTQMIQPSSIGNSFPVQNFKNIVE
jgi:hypothetical protein